MISQMCLKRHPFFIQQNMAAKVGPSQKCTMPFIVDANFSHKPATLIPGTLTVCPLATLPTLHQLSPLLLLEYNSEQHRQGVVSLSSFFCLFFFDVLSAFGSPLFFELIELGCGQVTSFPLASSAVLYGLSVMMQVFPLFVALSPG